MKSERKRNFALEGMRLFSCLMIACLCFAGMGRASAQAPFAPQIPLESEVPIALLVDVTSGQVLYSRNADRRFVPASITKVMSLYLAFELIEAGRLDLRQPITVKEGAAIEWSGKGSSMFLNPDDVVPLADLLTGIATVSANDASIVVAETASGSVPAWIAEMNSKAQSLGMTQSRFGTPNGWPDEGYTFTTANDLVVLAQAMIARHPAKYRRFIGQPDFRYGEIAQSNRDPLLGRVRGADGIKTGYTNEAGFGFLGSAKRDGQRLVLVVAGAGRNAVRARSARGLMEWGFAAFDRQRLFYKDEIVGEARVQNGSSSVVKLVTDRSVAVNVPKGKQSEVRMAVSYNGPIRAPISKGDQVAILEIKVPDMAPARVPLLAAEDVKQAGFFGRVLNAFSGWLN